MKPHQQRVVDEKTALDEKIVNLNVFIKQSPVFISLPVAEKGRLIAQKAYMDGYSEILGERIAAFKE